MLLVKDSIVTNKKGALGAKCESLGKVRSFPEQGRILNIQYSVLYCINKVNELYKY